MSFDSSESVSLFKKPSTLQLARFFLIVHTVSLFFSPPLVNLAEFLLWLSFLLVRDLRLAFADFFSTQIGRIFLLFIVTLFFGVIVAVLRGLVDYPSIWSWRKILIFPVAAVLYSCDDKARWRFLACYVFIAFLFACYGIWSSALSHSGDVVRNGSTQSVLLSVGVLGAGFLSLRASSLFRRLMMSAVLITCLFALIFVTSGRSGYVGLFVMIVTTYFLIGGKSSAFAKTAVLASILSVISVAMYLSPVANSRIKGTIDEIRAPISTESKPSTGVRKIFWVNTVNMIPNYWLIGAGVTSFGHAYSKHMTQQGYKEFIPTIDPHNQFLRILIEQGIIGLLVFLGLLGVLLRLGTLSMSGVFGACAVLAWCATSLFSAHFTTFVEGRLIWVLMGVFLASQAIVSKNQTHSN